MEPFRIVTGPAAPIIAPNVDTDVIMPKMGGKMLASFVFYLLGGRACASTV